MPFQPLTQGFGGSCGQNVHGSPALQIHHDAAETLAFVPSPIIHTNRPNRLQRRCILCRLLNPAQQSIVADPQTQTNTQPLARTAAQGVADRSKDLRKASVSWARLPATPG